jgi:drug/metabolite transporter (DMT)-like permease
MFYIGLGAALLASALFNIGISLQGLEAKAAPKDLAHHIGLLVCLLRRPLWLLGAILGFIGIAPQVLALSDAPFVVVQPALAAGLLLLLAIGARHFHEQVGWMEICGVVAIVAGIALVAWGAPPHHDTHRGGLVVLLTVGALCVGGVVPFATPVRSGIVTMIASGCGFAAANIATKLGSDDLGSRHYANAIAWGIVTLATGTIATILNMTAFQQARATTVVPVITSVQTFLPIVLEPLFIRESWHAASFVPLVAGVLIAFVGTVLVSRTKAVSKLAAAG